MLKPAKASEEKDRIHILNSMRGNGGDGINDTPPAKDLMYDKVSDAVRPGFISPEFSMRAAVAEDDDTWNPFLVALSKG